MAILEKGNDAMVALEVLIDRVGMGNVVQALALISCCKAEHTRVQDEKLARVWDNNSLRLSRCYRGIRRTKS
jgi:hypothetical protein